MNITIYSVEKAKSDEYEMVCAEFVKMASKYATIKLMPLWSKEVVTAQRVGEKDAKQAYQKLFSTHVGGYSVAMDERGEQMDSVGFSAIFGGQHPDIRLFIGGAYGFSEGFLACCHKKLSLSPMTLGHKVAKLVLSEQLYRALSIVHNHPYHKV